MTKPLLKRNTVLYGMEGSGLTTHGLLLAESLRHDFIDVNARIIEKLRQNPERGFSFVQEEVIMAIDKPNLLNYESPVVVAASQSVAEYPKLREHLLSLGGVGVYMRIGLDTLNSRLANGDGETFDRPEGVPNGQVFAARDSYYRELADIVLEVDRCGTIEENQEALFEVRFRQETELLTG